MSTDRCLQLNDAFCRRFLPPSAPNGHSLLLDLDNAIPFAPDAAQLGECLSAYATLIEEATREDPCDVLSVRGGSEIALAYLYRGLDAAGAPADAAVQSRLTRLLRKVLDASSEWFGKRWDEEMKFYDGFKCPLAMLTLLEALEAERCFRQRFLPAGAASPHDLLIDFQRQVRFTPSAAELQQCLDAYTDLIEKATRNGCMPVRWLLGGSELALAYLSRALEDGTPLPDYATMNRLTRLLRKTVADAVTLFGAMRWYEGFKRVDLLAWLLEEHAPRGLQGWHVLRARLRQTLRIG